MLGEESPVINMVTRPVLVGLLGASVVTGFVVGLLIGMYGAHPAHEQDDDDSVSEVAPEPHVCPHSTEDAFHTNKKISRHILNDINKDHIREYLEEIAKTSHVAGKPGSHRVAKYIHDQWASFGLQEVHIEKYEVLLSHPSDEHENQVVMTRSKGCGDDGVYKSQTAREAFVNNPDDSFPDAYHAYSPSGIVQGDVVYANYGTEEDFDQLERWKINVTGRLIITRYGKIFRGNKVANAAARKALGVLIYADPEEAAPDGELVYNKGGRWMPADGLQRGTIYEKIGDPLTPGLPAKDEMHRLELDEADLPAIPSQPISYEFARQILSRLAGEVVSSSNWKGGFKFRYRLGPKFEGEFENYTVCLSVFNELHDKDNIYNVIGVIPGSVEPDRYVIVGNPHDAWGYGYVNPSSSTAQLMEIARVLGNLHKRGWKPRRTIIFAAWDAGKFGQIGSTEWVEEHLPQLSTRTVAYINTESCVETDEFNVSASPILKKAVLRIAKLIPARIPEQPKQTLFDQWHKGDDDDSNKYADEGDEDSKPEVDPDDPLEGTAHDYDDDDNGKEDNSPEDEKSEKAEQKSKRKSKFTTIMHDKKKRSVGILETLLSSKSYQKRDADGDDDTDNDDDDDDGDDKPAAAKPDGDDDDDDDGDDGDDDDTKELVDDADKHDDFDEDGDDDDEKDKSDEDGTGETEDTSEKDDKEAEVVKEEDDSDEDEDDDSVFDDDDMDLFDTEQENFDNIVVSSLGAESDHAAFLFYAGIPSIDIHANNEKGADDYFPVLNTAYDNLEYFNKYVDPDMSRSRTCAQYTALLVRYLADSSILPYDVEHLGDILDVAQDKLKGVEQHLKRRNITVYDEFDKAVSEFEKAADRFADYMGKVDETDPIAVRIVNDQMMQLERVFIDPKGQEDDWFQRNLIFGPSDFDKNSDSVFNVLDDLRRRIDEIEEEEKSAEKVSAEDAVDDDSDNIEIDIEETWDEVEKYVAHLRVVINQATEFLDVYPRYHLEEEEKDSSDELSEAEQP